MGRGEGLLALARDESSLQGKGQIQTRDGFFVDSWVVMLQVINHAIEHREQIKSMPTALGIIPPNVDGWDYGESADAVVPVDQESKG